MNWSNKRTQVKGWHHVSQCVDASWTTWSIYRPKKGIDWSRVKTNASVIDDLSWLVLFSTGNLQPICSPSEPSTESQNGNFRSCNLPVRTSDLQCLEQMVSDAFYQHFSSCAAQPRLKKLYQQVVNIIRLPLVCFKLTKWDFRLLIQSLSVFSWIHLLRKAVREWKDLHVKSWFNTGFRFRKNALWL